MFRQCVSNLAQTQIEKWACLGMCSEKLGQTQIENLNLPQMIFFESKPELNPKNKIC